jgi:hypothetical protein
MYRLLEQQTRARDAMCASASIHERLEILSRTLDAMAVSLTELHRFELLSVFQTAEAFGRDRAFYWNSRLERRRMGCWRSVGYNWRRNPEIRTFQCRACGEVLTEAKEDK